MSLISTWSTIADDNGTLGSYPFYWPEGQPPSSVNNCARLMMSSIRTQFNQLPWFNWGYNVTRVAGNKFQVASASANTVTIAAVFQVGGRLKLFDTATLYGTITEVSASATVTNVTFLPDSGSLSASFTSVANSVITADNNSSIPETAVPAQVVTQNGAQLYAEDAGATDAYAAALDPVITSYITGMQVSIKVNTANTGGATLNLNGLGAKAILKKHDMPLATGDIEAGQIINLIYDGASFQMQSQLASTDSVGTVTSVGTAGLATGGPITGAGTVSVTGATQVQQQDHIASTVAVTPSVQQYHPSATKAYVVADSLGAIVSQYNVASVVDGGVGLITVNMLVPFSDTWCSINATARKDASTSNDVWITVDDAGGNSPTTGSFKARCASASNTLIDPNYWMFNICGDQS